MNFKFTKIKTLVALILSALVGIYYLLQSNIFGSASLFQVLTAKFIGFMFGFVICFVPIYVIWSLFDKSEQKSSSNIAGIIIGVLILLAILLFLITKFF